MLAFNRSLSKYAALGIAVVGGSMAPAFAGPSTVINFDNVRDGTNVSTVYQRLGVTFSCDGSVCSGKSAKRVFARATMNTASSPNSVTPLASGKPGVSDALTGRVVAAFQVPVQTVTIDAKSIQIPEPLNQTAYANVIAYDAQGAVVATATGNAFNIFQTLNLVSARTPIAKVSMGVTGPAAVAVFDNLTFAAEKRQLMFPTR